MKGLIYKIICFETANIEEGKGKLFFQQQIAERTRHYKWLNKSNFMYILLTYIGFNLQHILGLAIFYWNETNQVIFRWNEKQLINLSDDHA